MNADQEVEAWHSWQRACAFDLLGETEGSGLKQVVGHRFRSRVKRLNAFGARLPSPEDGTCAYLFESWCALHPRRDGKRYKDWLLTRGRRDLDTIQSGVMLLVRNVVREWVMDSHARTAALSLDQPLQEASGITLRELLPAKSCEDHSIHSEWKKQQAERLAEESEPVVRAVLRVRAEGRVFSHPQVQADTGFGKTLLHNTHRALLERVAKRVKQDFPDLDLETASALVLETLDFAGQMILKQLSAENRA